MTATVVSVSPLPLDRDSRSLRAARSLQRHGYRVLAVEGEASAAPDRFPFPVVSLRAPGARASGSAPSPLRRLIPRLLWECAAFAWFVFQVFVVEVVRGFRVVPAADLYYLHEYRLFPMVYAQARRRRAKILYDAHDFYPGVHAEADLTPFWRRVFQPFLAWLEGVCLRRVAGMVTVNAGIAALYREAYGIDAAVTRNCHDPTLDRPADTTLRAALSLPAETFLLVTVGNCKPGQDVAAGIAAMAGLPADVHLAFVGRGYDGFRPQIAAAGLESRVHLVGPVAADRMVPFIASASAALILYYPRSANDRHFLPNGLFHALAARLPLLYPNLRWIRALAEGYDIGVMIDPRDPGSIRDGVEALRRRIADPADGLAARLERAARENSWQAEEPVLLDLVRRALAE